MNYERSNDLWIEKLDEERQSSFRNCTLHGRTPYIRRWTEQTSRANKYDHIVHANAIGWSYKQLYHQWRSQEMPRKCSWICCKCYEIDWLLWYGRRYSTDQPKGYDLLHVLVQESSTIVWDYSMTKQTQEKGENRSW